MDSVSEYHIQGEHVEDGVYRSSDFPGDQIRRVQAEFSFRPDDVLIATYPKAGRLGMGTTWMSEVTWLLLHGGDAAAALRDDLLVRCPFLELRLPGRYDGLEAAGAAEAPRLLKTHMYCGNFSRAMRECAPRTIVVLRNVHDNLVSFYHFYRAMPTYSFPGTFSQFVELFKQKRLAHGDWFDFNLGWLQHEHDPNFLFVTFEEMKSNIRAVIQKLARFLKVDVSSDIIEKIVEHTSFNNMKANPTLKAVVRLQGMREDISPFIRKGEVGDARNHFPAELEAELTAMLRERAEGTPLRVYLPGADPAQGLPSRG